MGKVNNKVGKLSELLKKGLFLFKTRNTMKFIKEEGFDELLDQVLISKNVEYKGEYLNPILTVICDNENDEYFLREKLQKLGVKFTQNPEDEFLIPNSEWEKLIGEEWFEEKNIWLGVDGKQYNADEMSHQHLSNVIWTLKHKLEDGEIDAKDADQFLNQIDEVIVPQLQKRFNGELLEYKPFYNWEKKRPSKG